MLEYMLDTNIVIYVIKNRPPPAREAFNRAEARVCMSAITLSELEHGARKSQAPARNLRVVSDFVSRLAVLEYGARAAGHYGAIRALLESQGQTIGVNDLHIAAHARSEGLVLVTNNQREFARVDGLRVENWI